jgi:hypothetical protein
MDRIGAQTRRFAQDHLNPKVCRQPIKGSLVGLRSILAWTIRACNSRQTEDLRIPELLGSGIRANPIELRIDGPSNDRRLVRTIVANNLKNNS